MRRNAVLRAATAPHAPAGRAAPAAAGPVIHFRSGRTISITHAGGEGCALAVRQDAPAVATPPHVVDRYEAAIR